MSALERVLYRMDAARASRVEDARNVFALRIGDLEERGTLDAYDLEPERLKRLVRDGLELHAACEYLAKRVEVLEQLLEQRARWKDVPPTTAGGVLVAGRTAGGWRHFLNDRPVHAGEHLCLLTKNGWVSGTYEWGFDPERRATFYMTLPGADGSVSLSLPFDARLAWPEELKAAAEARSA